MMRFAPAFALGICLLALPARTYHVTLIVDDGMLWNSQEFTGSDLHPSDNGKESENLDGDKPKVGFFTKTEETPIGENGGLLEMGATRTADSGARKVHNSNIYATNGGPRSQADSRKSPGGRRGRRESRGTRRPYSPHRAGYRVAPMPAEGRQEQTAVKKPNQVDAAASASNNRNRRAPVKRAVHNPTQRTPTANAGSRPYRRRPVEYVVDIDDRPVPMEDSGKNPGRTGTGQNAANRANQRESSENAENKLNRQRPAGRRMFPPTSPRDHQNLDGNRAKVMNGSRGGNQMTAKPTGGNGILNMNDEQSMDVLNRFQELLDDDAAAVPSRKQKDPSEEPARRLNRQRSKVSGGFSFGYGDEAPQSATMYSGKILNDDDIKAALNGDINDKKQRNDLLRSHKSSKDSDDSIMGDDDEDDADATIATQKDNTQRQGEDDDEDDTDDMFSLLEESVSADYDTDNGMSSMQTKRSYEIQRCQLKLSRSRNHSPGQSVKRRVREHRYTNNRCGVSRYCSTRKRDATKKIDEAYDKTNGNMRMKPNFVEMSTASVRDRLAKYLNGEGEDDNEYGDYGEYADDSAIDGYSDDDYEEKTPLDMSKYLGTTAASDFDDDDLGDEEAREYDEDEDADKNNHQSGHEESTDDDADVDGGVYGGGNGGAIPDLEIDDYDDDDGLYEVEDYETEDEIDAFESPIGLEYLGAGYDLVKGNPLGDTVTMLDPGYRANIIQMHWKKDFEGISNSLHYIQPKGAWVRSYISCHKGENVSDVGRSQSLKDALSVDAAVSASLPGDVAKFAASINYNNIKRAETSENRKTYVSRSYCFNYVAGIPTSIKWDFTAAFNAALQKLPKKFEYQVTDARCLPSDYRDDPTSKACVDLGVRRWMRFFSIFGTHVTSKVYLGGKLVTLMETSAGQEAKLSRLGVDVKAQLQVQAKAATVDASAGTTVSKSRDTSKLALDSKSSTFALGGDIYGKGYDLTFNEWAATVSQHSMPIKAEYTPLAIFLGPQYMAAYNDAYLFYGKVLVGGELSKT
ncbi:perforin-like protein PLP1 [Babesia caballi]|uniref:Perforin-like protein PLP1 n=1 Tax=Babesia caballi TaxID=5871 RepID=A0AAV4LVJ0_BABCB|nr:perforin-like protein PLP1 [Babesia caballi]